MEQARVGRTQDLVSAVGDTAGELIGRVVVAFVWNVVDPTVRRVGTAHRALTGHRRRDAAPGPSQESGSAEQVAGVRRGARGTSAPKVFVR